MISDHSDSDELAIVSHVDFYTVKCVGYVATALISGAISQ